MGHSRFEFDASFIVPAARDGLTNLATLVLRHPDSPVSVFAHADPTGSDDYNKPLSGRRALAVYGMLVRDVELWERLYSSPMTGDRWGERAVQRILSVLTDEAGEPYYPGVVDDQWGTKSREALERYQGANVDPDGQPLTVDGQLGPLSRKSMYLVYMDWLCTQDDGYPLKLEPEQFLAKGADPDLRGDVQGCSEFNPRMVFSTEEHAKYQAFAHKQERDEENADNRRAVVFLYPVGVEVDPQWWPCPAAESGVSQCHARFWSDASTRRNPQPLRRHFDGDANTFGCRFYHFLGLNSQVETPVTLGHTFDVYLHRQLGHGLPEGTFALVSDDDEVDERKPASAALLIDAEEDREVRCLSFTGLRRGKRYTLSFQPSGDEAEEFEPVVLVAEFMLEDFIGDDAGQDAEEIAIVAGQDDSPLHYASSPPGSDQPLPAGGPDPEQWQVEDEAVEWDGMTVVLTRVREDELPPDDAPDEDEDDDG